MPHRRPKLPALSRRAALLLPAAALGGCSLLESWFGETKIPLPGTRIAVMTSSRGLQVDPGARRQVTLPEPIANVDWPQPGGKPAHEMGRLAWAGDAARAPGRPISARAAAIGARSPPSR